MAAGRKTGGRDFEPGNPGGPGAPKIPEELKAAKKLNRLTCELLLNECINLTNEEHVAAASNPQSTGLKVAICNIIIKAIAYGDHQRVNFLLDRMIGKVVDKVEHKVPKPTVMKLIGEDAVLVIGSHKNKDDEEE